MLALAVALCAACGAAEGGERALPPDDAGRADATAATSAQGRGPEPGPAAGTDAGVSGGSSSAAEPTGAAGPGVASPQAAADGTGGSGSAAGAETKAAAGDRGSAATPDAAPAPSAQGGDPEPGPAVGTDPGLSGGPPAKASGSGAADRSAGGGNPSPDGGGAGEAGGNGAASAPEPPAASAAPAGAEPAAEPEQPTVTLTIRGEGDIGVILDAYVLPLNEGDTVLELTKRATRAEKIPMEYRGRGALAYVEGIDNLYEFDHGPESGWLYYVNGERPKQGAGVYKPASGDRIEWVFVLEKKND
jgi:hypothetical protein